MKKRFGLLAFLSVFFGSLVSAGPVEGVGQLLEGLKDILYLIATSLSEIIYDLNTVDEFLFWKIILTLLFFLVIYTVLDKNRVIGDSKGINRIVAGAISILAIRFVPADLIETIFLQYGILGSALGIFVPFVIILFFLHQSNIGPLPRKIGWVIYGISYIAIWANVGPSLGGIPETIYWIGILAIILCFFFDRQIHAQFGEVALKQARRSHEATRYADIQTKITEIETKISQGGLPDKVIRELEKRRNYLSKELSKIAKSL